jgi:glycosyltransferase involved in cell wall biosynthesis
MTKLTVSLVIPCLNEAQTLRECILDAKKYGNKFFRNAYEILVSDNGSTDGSLKIAKKEGIRIIKVPVRGYGAALHWGILNSKSTYSLIADADLSYPFSNLKMFKKMIIKKPDLVLGSRLKGKIEKGAMPFLHRYFGTPVLTALIRIIYGIKTTDCNSGMRLIKNNFYKNLNMRNSGMEWASELLLKTALKKGKYLEVKIDFKKDKRVRRPHLDTWADGWRLGNCFFDCFECFFLQKKLCYKFFVVIFGLCPISVFVDFATFENGHREAGK